MPIAESDQLVAVFVTPSDNGGGASVTRTCGYGLNAAANPPQLNVYSRDEAGVLADCVLVSVVVFASF